jgi:hypothetical protein
MSTAEPHDWTLPPDPRPRPIFARRDGPPRLRPWVRCAECAHYRPDPLGWGGMGECVIAAPASLRPGSLWPGSEVECEQWVALQCPGA